MIRLHVIAEGDTEETFIKELIAPVLIQKNVLATPRLIGGNGGDVRYARLKRDALMFLKGDPSAYCTTFIDYYGMGRGFPGRDELGVFDQTEKKKRALEDAIHQDIAGDLGNRYDHSRFIPYVQMHEFEGLLFSDTARLASGIYKPELSPSFKAIRDLFATPEDIDEGRTTAPSKRIAALYPGYNKQFLGSLAALEIGLDVIRANCALFNAWLTQLEQLEERERPPGAASGAQDPPT